VRSDDNTLLRVTMANQYRFEVVGRGSDATKDIRVNRDRLAPDLVAQGAQLLFDPSGGILQTFRTV